MSNDFFDEDKILRKARTEAVVIAAEEERPDDWGNVPWKRIDIELTQPVWSEPETSVFSRTVLREVCEEKKVRERLSRAIDEMAYFDIVDPASV